MIRKCWHAVKQNNQPTTPKWTHSPVKDDQLELMGKFAWSEIVQIIINHLKLFAKNEKELETLIQAIRIYNQDIGMEFNIEKCSMLIMKSGKWYLTKGIEQPNQEKIRTLGAKENYKFLEIL